MKNKKEDINVKNVAAFFSGLIPFIIGLIIATLLFGLFCTGCDNNNKPTPSKNDTIQIIIIIEHEIGSYDPEIDGYENDTIQ